MGDLCSLFCTRDLQQAEVGVCWIREGRPRGGRKGFLRNYCAPRERGETFMIASRGKYVFYGLLMSTGSGPMSMKEGYSNISMAFSKIVMVGYQQKTYHRCKIPDAESWQFC